MAFVNEFIGYIDRSYQQAKASILAKLVVKIPEMTDHTENNIFIRQVGIWTGILEQLGYYIDNKAREVFITTLRKYTSIVKIAKLFDYRIHGNSAATVTVRFFFDSALPAALLIPAGTIIGTKEGINFVTLNDVTIPIGGTEVSVDAKNWTLVPAAVLGTSSGMADQVFEIVENVVDGSIVLTVDVDSYQAVDSLAYSIGTSQHYIETVTENKKMSVLFGDDTNGKIPPIGKTVTADYYTSDGAAGNVGIGSITEIISTIPMIGIPPEYVFKVTNDTAAGGGVDQEGLEILRKRIPRSIRTLNRAVTRQDYQDIAEMFNGVEKAAVSFQCGKTVDVYIAPTGGGPANQTLLDDVFDYFDDKRMITTKVRTLSAGQVQIYIEAAITALPNYNNSTVKSTALANLISFLSVANQEISGQVYEGDVYQVIENSLGVKVSQLVKLYALPFALPTPSTNLALNWTRTLKEASTVTKKWRVKMSNTTVYQLYRDNIFLGLFNVGTTYDFPEIQLNVATDSYTAGMEWSFNTYKFFGSVVLDEFSVPYADSTSIVLNVTGGI